jgi:hypothetical protein
VTPASLAALTPPQLVDLPDNLRRRLSYFFNPVEIDMLVYPPIQEPKYERLDIHRGGPIPANLEIDVLWH